MINTTIDAYNKYARVYDEEVVDFWNNFPPSIVNKFVSLLNGKDILNVGSGSGRDALILKRNGLNVTCLDMSKEMIKWTKSLGFKSILCDMKEMKFNDGSFDGVWAFTSILHLTQEDAKLVIDNIYKLLKSNGIFLLGMMEGEFEGEKERDSMPKSKRYFRYYTEKELDSLVNPNNFQLVFQERYIPSKNVYLSRIYKKKDRSF